MLNNANYEQLKLWLKVEGYNISEFEETTIAMIYGSYFIVDTNKVNYSISIFQDEETNKLEVLAEEKIDCEWHVIEQKFYKTAKGAFNKIKQLMNK